MKIDVESIFKRFEQYAPSNEHMKELRYRSAQIVKRVPCVTKEPRAPLKQSCLRINHRLVMDYHLMWGKARRGSVLHKLNSCAVDTPLQMSEAIVQRYGWLGG